MADITQHQKQTESGWIPATRRPDGTWRKARRVKEGYVPPDEVEKYESKGKQWMKIQSNIPPGASEAETGEPAKLSKNQKKNERKKQKRKEKRETETKDDEAEDVTAVLSSTSLTEGNGGLETKIDKPITNPKVDSEAKTKKIKNLKKKLRQIDELQAKVHSGEIKVLTTEQKEKLARKAAILEEVNELEEN